MFCRYCGTQLPEGSRICTNCGNKLAQADEDVPFPSHHPDSGQVKNGLYETDAAPAQHSRCSHSPSGKAAAIIILALLIAAGCAYYGRHFLPGQTVDWDRYAGSWVVDRYSSMEEESDQYVELELENNAGQFYLTVISAWEQGEQTVTIRHLKLQTGDRDSTAAGYYEDTGGNTGIAQLSVRRGKLYLTVTSSATDKQWLQMKHERCTRSEET